MSIINKGTAFSNGEQLTADKLNDLVDLATFDQSATDSASTTVNTSGQIVVADSGVSTAKIAADAVTTAKILDANVTKAKIEDVADYKVLGNVSGAAAAPAEVSILDEDDMTSDSATALATQQSIKAYVDAAGSIAQTKLISTTTEQTTTSAIPFDNTTPQITEGIQAMTGTMTPLSTSNLIKATLTGFFGNTSAGQYVIVSVFEGSTCIGVSQIQQPSSGTQPLSATYYFNPAATTEQTYSVRFGNGGSGTSRIDTTPTFGGLNKATLFLEEISG